MFTPIYTEFDRKIWEEELSSFVPDSVFDAHCHLWREEDAGSNADNGSALRLPVNGRRMLEWSQIIYPRRRLGFYYLGTPIAGCNLLGHNNFLAGEARGNRMPAAALVTPDLTAGEVAALFEKGFSGLKPYRLFTSDPAQCDIADYLPEAQVEVADHYHGKITLHLSKRDGIADGKNQKDLRDYCRRYPHVQWILAHCARAFNSFMLERASEYLSELGDNVWFDTSAVCDVYSHYLLFKHQNRARLMFGSDNIGAGSAHGSYITWGHAWSFQEEKQCPHCNGSATLVIYEQLRAMKHAAEMTGLTDGELQDIFCNNAVRLFGASIREVDSFA